LQDVRDGDEIALRIDEEGVAEKSVANAFVAGRFVAGINDGAECSFESGIGLRGRRLLCGGTIWKDDRIPAELSRSMRCEQKSLPGRVSTSCVMMAQPAAPSGQNQMKGIR